MRVSSLTQSIASILCTFAVAVSAPAQMTATTDFPQHGFGGYMQHNLVSDGAVTADHVDPNLVNAWGLAFNPSGAAWVANNGSTAENAVAATKPSLMVRFRNVAPSIFDLSAGRFPACAVILTGAPFGTTPQR